MNAQWTLHNKWQEKNSCGEGVLCFFSHSSVLFSKQCAEEFSLPWQHSISHKAWRLVVANRKSSLVEVVSAFDNNDLCCFFFAHWLFMCEMPSHTWKHCILTVFCTRWEIRPRVGWTYCRRMEVSFKETLYRLSGMNKLDPTYSIFYLT